MKIKHILPLLLLAGCSFTSKEEGQALAQAIMQVGNVHNKVAKCLDEAKSFKDVKPCLYATPTPTATPEVKK